MNSSELDPAPMSLASGSGLAVPNAFMFMYLTTSLGVIAANSSLENCEEGN